MMNINMVMNMVMNIDIAVDSGGAKKYRID